MECLAELQKFERLDCVIWELSSKEIEALERITKPDILVVAHMLGGRAKFLDPPVHITNLGRKTDNENQLELSIAPKLIPHIEADLLICPSTMGRSELLSLLDEDRYLTPVKVIDLVELTRKESK